MSEEFQKWGKLSFGTMWPNRIHRIDLIEYSFNGGIKSMQAKLDAQAEELAKLRGFAKTLYEKNPDLVDFFIDFNLMDEVGNPTQLLTGKIEVKDE